MSELVFFAILSRDSVFWWVIALSGPESPTDNTKLAVPDTTEIHPFRFGQCHVLRSPGNFRKRPVKIIIRENCQILVFVIFQLCRGTWLSCPPGNICPPPENRSGFQPILTIFVKNLRNQVKIGWKTSFLAKNRQTCFRRADPFSGGHDSHVPLLFLSSGQE